MAEPLPFEQTHIDTLRAQTVLGGLGQSGNGHEKSLLAFAKYTNHKTAWMQL